MSPPAPRESDSGAVAPKIASRLTAYLEDGTNTFNRPEHVVDISQFQSEIRANNERLRSRIQALRNEVSNFEQLRNGYGNPYLYHMKLCNV